VLSYTFLCCLATGDAAGCDTPARSSAEIAATKKLLQRCGVRAETFERLQAELDCLDAKSFMYRWPELEETVGVLPSRSGSVAVGPGATAFTEISRPRSSFAKIFVSVSIADLVAA
jgi:hypothetical protein